MATRTLDKPGTSGSTSREPYFKRVVPNLDQAYYAGDSGAEVPVANVRVFDLLAEPEACIKVQVGPLSSAGRSMKGKVAVLTTDDPEVLEMLGEDLIAQALKLKASARKVKRGK